MDGEQVELTGAAMVSSISGTRMVAQGLVVAALTAGAATAVSVPKRLWVALTDQRLLFLEPSALSGRPTSKVVAQLPRPALTCTGTRTRMLMFIVPTLLADLAVAGSQTGLRLTFASGVPSRRAADRRCPDDRRAVAAQPDGARGRTRRSGATKAALLDDPLPPPNGGSVRGLPRQSITLCNQRRDLYTALSFASLYDVLPGRPKSLGLRLR